MWTRNIFAHHKLILTRMGMQLSTWVKSECISIAFIGLTLQGKPGRKCSGGGSASWSNSTRGASGNKACRLWHGNATNSDSICFSLSSHENLYDSLHITLEHFAYYYIHIIRATCWFIPANTWGQLVQRRLSAFGILQSFARAWHIVHNRDTLRTLCIPL